MEDPGSAPPEDEDEPQRKAFMADLFEFMRERGTPIIKVPQLGHRAIDLYMLYKQVTARGGIQQVIDQKLWKEIAKYFQFPSTCTNASFILRINYIGYLYYYEQVRFFNIMDPQPPPATLGPIPNRKDLPLPPAARTPPTSRRRETAESEEEEGDDDEGGESSSAPPPAKQARTAGNSVASAAPSSTARVTIQPLSIPIYQAPPNMPLGATVNRPRTGLEPLAYGLQTGPDFLREWATQVLLHLSTTSDIRLSQVPGLLTALSTRLRAELQRVAGEDLSSQGFSVGWPSRQAAQRLSTILRNIALIPEADADIASHSACVQALLQYADCPDDIVRENSLEALAALAPFLGAADATAAVPHLLRALVTDSCDVEVFLHAVLQLSLSPKMEPLFLLSEAWRADLFAALMQHLLSREPSVVLLALQILYNLSVAGGTTLVAQNAPIVKQLARFITAEVRGLWRQEELTRKAALLLFNFSKSPGPWLQELRRHGEDFVTGACLLGTTPIGGILQNLLNNLVSQ